VENHQWKSACVASTCIPKATAASPKRRTCRRIDVRIRWPGPTEKWAFARGGRERPVRATPKVVLFWLALLCGKLVIGRQLSLAVAPPLQPGLHRGLNEERNLLTGRLFFLWPNDTFGGRVSPEPLTS
jgi:hypothetical protein